MSRFEISRLQKSSAWALYRMRERIKMDPVYQRQGDVWDLEKRQLLIDTIINGFDVPKLYLHKFPSPVSEMGSSYEYAMIDGKQRTEAIFNFIDNNFPLDSDFNYLPNEDVRIGGMTYRELASNYPDVKQDFDSFSLDVITIETDDIELIEDLFSRLNEAVPLNAAEKRNAKPGPLPKIVRQVSTHPFYVNKMPFGNSRYRHYDIIAKMLLLASRDGVVDTKKVYLDRFFDDNSHMSEQAMEPLRAKVEIILEHMVNVFVDQDPLLRSIGMISLFFLIFERAVQMDQVNLISRRTFVTFEEQRRQNRQLAEGNLTGAKYALLEFDRLAQSPNDGVAMRYRLAVMDSELFGQRLGFATDGILESRDERFE